MSYEGVLRTWEAHYAQPLGAAQQPAQQVAPRSRHLRVVDESPPPVAFPWTASSGHPEGEYLLGQGQGSPMIPNLLGSGPDSDSGSTLYAGFFNGLDPHSGSDSPGFGAPPSATGFPTQPGSGIAGGGFASFGPFGNDPAPPSGGTFGSTTYQTAGSSSPAFAGLTYIASQTVWDSGGDNTLAGYDAGGPIGGGQTSYVPEPGTLTLMLTGVLALAAVSRKRRRG